MQYQPPLPPAPGDEPVYGPPEPPRRRLPRAVLAGGLAAGLALGGAGIAYAASSSGGSSPANAAASGPTSTTPSTLPNGKSPGHPGRSGMKEGGFGLPGLGFPGLRGRVLYGQATIQQPDGTTKTVEYQSGSVSSVSGSSITLSTGSYTHTYKVDPSTVVDAQAGGISTVAKGDQVRLLATQQGGTDTAVNIVDVTKIQSSRSGFGFEGGAKGDSQAPSGASPTSVPATGAFWGGPGGPGGGGPGVDSQSGVSEVQ